MSKKNTNPKIANTLTNTRKVSLLKDIKSDMVFNDSLNIFKDINSDFYQTPQCEWIVATSNGNERQNFFNRLDVAYASGEEIESKKAELREKKKKSKKEKQEEDITNEDEEVSDDEAINIIITQKINSYLREKGGIEERGRGSYGLRKFICQLRSNTTGDVKVLFFFPAVIQTERKEENNRVNEFIRDCINSRSTTTYKFYQYSEARYVRNKYLEISVGITAAYLDTYISLYTFANNSVVFGNRENDNIMSYTENNNRDRVSLFNCFTDSKGKTLNALLSSSNVKYMSSSDSFFFTFNVRKIFFLIKKDSITRFNDLFVIDKDELSSTLTFNKESILKTNKSPDYNVYEHLNYIKGDARRNKIPSYNGNLFKRRISGTGILDDNKKAMQVEDIHDELIKTSPGKNYSGTPTPALIKIEQYLDEGPLEKTLNGYFSVGDAGDTEFKCLSRKSLNNISDVSANISGTKKKVYIATSSKQKELFKQEYECLTDIEHNGFKKINDHLSDLKNKIDVDFNFEFYEINDHEGHEERENSIRGLFKKVNTEKAWLIFSHLYDNSKVVDDFGGHAIPEIYFEDMKLNELGLESRKSKAALEFNQIVALYNFMSNQMRLGVDEVRSRMKELLNHFDTYTYIKGCNMLNLFGDNISIPTQGISYNNLIDSNVATKKSFVEALLKDKALCDHSLNYKGNLNGIEKFSVIDVTPINMKTICSKLKKLSTKDHCNFDFLNLFFDDIAKVNVFAQNAKEKRNFVTAQKMDISVSEGKMTIDSSTTASCALKKGGYRTEQNVNQIGFYDFDAIIGKSSLGYSTKSLYFIFNIDGRDVIVSDVDIGSVALCRQEARDFHRFLSSVGNDFIENKDEIIRLYEETANDHKKTLRNNIEGDKPDILIGRKPKDAEDGGTEVTCDIKISLSRGIVQNGLAGDEVYYNDNLKICGAKTFQISLGSNKGNGTPSNRQSGLCKVNTFAARIFADKGMEHIDLPETLQNFLLGQITDDVILTERFSAQSFYQKLANLKLGK